MEKLLLRLFVRDYENTGDPKVRTAVGRLAGRTGIFCNLLLFAGKLTAGILSGSVSITADAMNNLSDAVSAVVALVGFRLAERPADEDHPYGHARYEYLSTLAVAALIVFIGFELAKSSVEKIFHPEPMVFSLTVVLVLTGSILVKLWLSGFNRSLGKHIGSGTLLAVGVDSRNDVIATSAVLLATCLEAGFGWKADGFMGLGVAGFILYSGVQQARQTVSVLLGEATDPQLRQKIARQVERESMVLGYHDLLVHDYGPAHRFASLHVEMDREEDPLLCHEIIDRIERRCLRKYGIHLVIHYDPVVTDDPRQDQLRRITEEALRQMDAALLPHDFRVIPGRVHLNVVFDVALPDRLAEQEAPIEQAVLDALTARTPGQYHLHITFDRENI